MKIAYVVARGDEIGGAHIHVADLAEECTRRGHEALIFAGEGDVYSSYLRKRKVPHRVLKKLGRTVKMGRDAGAVLELNRALRHYHPDLVSLHSAKAGVIGRLAACGLKCPVIFTAHGWSFTDGVSKGTAALYRIIERAMAPLCDRIITVSDFDRDLAIRSKIGIGEKITTVWNGRPDIDPSLIANPASGKPRLIMVARFEAQKDHALLVLALAALKEEEWEIVFIGDGPLRGNIERTVAAESLTAKVHFLGRSDSVAAELARSHIFVLSTNWEGLPRSIIEAMRAGLPVVATAVGGVAELVKDGENGFLVRRGNPADLVSSVKRLIEDPVERTEMGHCSRQLYQRYFSQERWLSETFGIYEQVICGAKG